MNYRCACCGCDCSRSNRTDPKFNAVVQAARDYVKAQEEHDEYGVEEVMVLITAVKDLDCETYPYSKILIDWATLVKKCLVAFCKKTEYEANDLVNSHLSRIAEAVGNSEALDIVAHEEPLYLAWSLGGIAQKYPAWSDKRWDKYLKLLDAED